MPFAPKHPCSKPGCPALVERGHSCCEEHTKQRAREYDAQRDPADKQYYSTPQWKRLRSVFLMKHPICITEGCHAPATTVDHIVPRSQGGTDDESNLRGQCKSCHGRRHAIEGDRWGRRVRVAQAEREPII